MKNNKGFTLVELLSTFILSSIIIILLFQLIINLKEVYQQSGLKTELLNKQYILTNKIYTDLNEKKAVGIESCNSALVCIDFTFADGSVKRLEANDTNKTISYDNTVLTLNNNSYFNNINITTTELQTSEKIFNVDIPIYNTIIENENFGLNIVYTYDSNETTNNYGNLFVPPLTQYTYIPYVKTNGYQKIKLDYKAKTTTEIRLDIELTENALTRTTNSQNRTLIGIDGSGSNKFNANFGSTEAQYNQIFYWLDKGTNDGAAIYTKKYETITNRSVLTMKSGEATFQNETITVATKTEDNTENMILLGTSTSSFNKYDSKIYSFQVYEGNKIIKHMIPAKRNSDNKIGLYDIITNTFYTSNGSSGFIYND